MLETTRILLSIYSILSYYFDYSIDHYNYIIMFVDYCINALIQLNIIFMNYNNVLPCFHIIRYTSSDRQIMSYVYVRFPSFYPIKGYY